MEPEGLGLPPGLGAPSRARVLFMSQEGRGAALGGPSFIPTDGVSEGLSGLLCVWQLLVPACRLLDQPVP